MKSKIDSNDILGFWFSEPVAKMWFNSTAEFDDELKLEYESVYLDAAKGQYDSWLETATGCLALIILFDQFPLNMYRGKQESFATEARSREVTRHALTRNFDDELHDEKQKAFLYMPFMHSEDIEDQDKSVELYEKANLTNNIRFARHHREIIKRFGRFPHRNNILNRQSTDAELAYLQSKQAFLG